MNAFESRFHANAVAALDELRAECLADLEGGSPQTYDEYRERTGYLRALRAAKDELEAIRKKLLEI